MLARINERENMRLRVGLGSEIIHVTSVQMHSLSAIRKYQDLLARGQTQMETFSTGLGFWGSPGYVLAGAAMLGMLENAVTDKNRKQGLKTLTEAVGYLDRLRARGVFVSVDDITNIERPNPSEWTAYTYVQAEAILDGMDSFALKKLIREHDVSQEELNAGVVWRETAKDVGVLPDDFLTVVTENGAMQLRWSAVQSIQTV